jgi:hypothetical protein
MGGFVLFGGLGDVYFLFFMLGKSDILSFGWEFIVSGFVAELVLPKLSVLLLFFLLQGVVRVFSRVCSN